MYYPYLRGRQFELIALREYALQRGDKNNIVPILEPVKNTFNSMNLALPKLIEGNVKFALILNPQVGDFSEMQDYEKALNIKSELEDKLIDQSKWIPAFVINNNYTNILKLIEDFGFDHVMVICTEITDTSASHFDDLVLSPKVKYIVTKENKTLKRRLKGLGKEIIRLDDKFNAQKRNSDYLVMPEERFSDEHIFYIEEGYSGFSDYTVLFSDFTEGGAAPFAVAIHWTYQKANNEVWIRHFTSKTNDDRSNIQGKFAEAAKKAVAFFDKMDIHNCASEELRKYYNDGDGTYPGLGMVKKISIKNHLELINGLLTEE